MTGFVSFDGYLDLDRVTDIAVSPDGSRLVATVASLAEKGEKFVNSLYELDPAGERPARRLTRSARGESAPVFAPDGALLFVSARGKDDDDPAELWRLPVVGEAAKAASRPASIQGAVVAREAGTVVFASAVLPGATDEEADRARRAARKDLKVNAVLHRQTPIRYWDHDLGPDERHLFVLDDDGPRDLTPDAGRALDEQSFAITPDGATVVASWEEHVGPARRLTRLVTIDVATGERRTVVADPQASLAHPAVSLDGRWAVCTREQETTYADPPKVSLTIVDLRDGGTRELVADPDIWPGSPVFGADAATIFFLADEHGHAPVFRLDVASDAWTRVTAAGHHTALRVAPDGRSLYALRDSWAGPPRPVRIDATGTDGGSTELDAPGALPADVTRPPERVSTTAADGTTVEAWLVLPPDASAESPAPLLLWMHGGPLGSWNGWSWRWNPWLMIGKGYGVLLPDPALSTGYGAAMIQRGWGEWGGAPFTDLMSITDAVVARPDVDATRTAAMGGSYGGYLANWVAGHTDRFRCIVTHASLWHMEQFQGTTDAPDYWALEWGLPEDQPERYEQWSPHLFLDDIRTPMLVVHGDLDYRVPISEALRLWWDLRRKDVESAYLYFPDEGHWILKPGNARVWYETVWAWLAEHLDGQPWRQPELL